MYAPPNKDVRSEFTNREYLSGTAWIVKTQAAYRDLCKYYYKFDEELKNVQKNIYPKEYPCIITFCSEHCGGYDKPDINIISISKILKYINKNK